MYNLNNLRVRVEEHGTDCSGVYAGAQCADRDAGVCHGMTRLTESSGHPDT